MQKWTITLLLGLHTVFSGLHGQHKEIDRLIKGELSMTFPSIYFKNNSTEYAVMPYTADSCFKYISSNLKELVSFAIWQDSSESEELTKKRIEKLKSGLDKYEPSEKIHILAMGEAQKISRTTIHKGADNKQIQYLLSLNSVFDVYGTRGVIEARKHCCFLCFLQGRCKFNKRGDHATDPRRWCPVCWYRVSKGVQKFGKKRK